MVIRARSSSLIPLYNFLLAELLFLSPAFSVTQIDSISFEFNNTPLKTALRKLIDDYGISIVYPDDIANNPISARCISCSEKEAIVSVLSTSNLVWEQTGDQFTILNSTKPFRFGILGRAMDKESGDPIPYANIFIPELKIGDISRSDGTFSISNISSQACTLTISYIGYETGKVHLLFPKDESIFQEIFIEPKIISSKSISIMGETREFMDRSNSPGQISFSPRHISTLPNLGEVDIFRSLQLLPGIQLGLGGTSGLFIRGGTPDQNLILLDGMPLYQTGHIFGFISGINANSIKDIQVYKGGFPAQYGGRISSVIELTSRNGNSLKPHGGISGNLMSQGISGELPLLSRGSWIFNLRRSTTSNYQTGLYQAIQEFVTGDDKFNLIGESADSTKNQSSSYSPQFSYQDFSSRFSFIISPKNRITITNTTGRDSIRENREFFGFGSLLGRDDDDDSISAQEMTEWRSVGSILNWSSNWNHEWDTQLTLSNNEYTSSYDSEYSARDQLEEMIIGTANEKNYLKDKTIKLHNRFNGLENHQFEFGIDETFYENRFYDEKTDVTKSHTTVFEQSGFLHSFYLQTRWIPSEKWIIKPGIRVTYFSEQEKYYSSPRISIINRILPNLTIESSMGKHYQFIHQLDGNYTTRGTQGMWIISSNQIPNISSTNHHLGFNLDHGDYSITTEFYYRILNDIFQLQNSYIPTASLNRNSDGDFIHNGNGYSKGIELLLRRKKGRVTGWVSYHRNKTQVEFPELNDGDPFLSDHDVSQEFKSVVMTTIGSWNFTANWVFASGRVFTHLDDIQVDPSDNILISKGKNEQRLDSIHHLDISMSKTWLVSNTKFHFGLSVYNLYNQNNISHKRYNPFTSSLSSTNVIMFGITPTLFLQISF